MADLLQRKGLALFGAGEGRQWGAPGRLPVPGQYAYEGLQVRRPLPCPKRCCSGVSGPLVEWITLLQLLPAGSQYLAARKAHSNCTAWHGQHDKPEKGAPVVNGPEP